MNFVDERLTGQAAVRETILIRAVHHAITDVPACPPFRSKLIGTLHGRNNHPET